MTVPTSNVTVPTTTRSGRTVRVCEIYQAGQGGIEARVTRDDN